MLYNQAPISLDYKLQKHFGGWVLIKVTGACCYFKASSYTIWGVGLERLGNGFLDLINILNNIA